MSKGIIIVGMLVFLFVVTVPVWYTPAAGGSGPRLQPELPADQTKCIEDKAFMTSNHMVLLHTWRDMVVREGIKEYETKSGEKVLISLTKNCMKCHVDKSKFCDRCHNYSDVYPNCWNCHVEPVLEGK